jgi:BirA family transcriptional regulator, biotin operon repressor / biotin---[acetyl-CoA-carboxylase] ligase
VSREEIFRELARHGRAARMAWPADEPLDDYGLAVRDDWIVPAAPFDPLREADIRQGLSRRARQWLVHLDVWPSIGSTNAELMERGRRGSIDGAMCTAELQLSGRGRRGRAWASPFGANIAMSLGIAVDASPAELGGASLVVGLAALDALEQLGISGLAVKWPNDLLLNGAKLGGILIEMSQSQGTELVVGLGLNVALPESVRRGLPESVADLAGVDPPPRRSQLVAAIASSIVDFVDEFSRLGLAPFIPVFNRRHHFHGCQCQVLQAEGPVSGKVSGVSERGELILETVAGPVTFNSGEVSLRQG